jgi:hypothetical protein
MGQKLQRMARRSTPTQVNKQMPSIAHSEDRNTSTAIIETTNKEEKLPRGYRSNLANALYADDPHALSVHLKACDKIDLSVLLTKRGGKLPSKHKKRPWVVEETMASVLRWIDDDLYGTLRWNTKNINLHTLMFYRYVCLMHIYVYMHAYRYTQTQTCAHKHNTYAYTYTYEYTYTHTYTYPYTDTYTYTYTHTYACIHRAYKHIHMHILI